MGQVITERAAGVCNTSEPGSPILPSEVEVDATDAQLPPCLRPLAALSRMLAQTAPLFPVALGMLVGILLGDCSPLPPWGGISLFFVLVGVLFGRRVRVLLGPVLVFGAAACVGQLLYHRAACHLPADSIERHATDRGRIVRLTATVVSDPRTVANSNEHFKYWTYRGARTVFLAEVETLQGLDGPIGVSGRLRVGISEAVLDLAQGDRVELFGQLFVLCPPSNPGGFDWAAYNRRQGVVASLRCPHRENVRCLEQPEKPASSALGWLRARVRGLLTDDLATGAREEQSLLQAMILGHRAQLDRRLNDIFIRAGCIHFLAVSGIHVVIVMLGARLLGRLLLLSRRSNVWLMMAAVVLYVLIAEPRPPILRASVISLIFCVAVLLERGRTCLNWISATVIVLALLDPLTVFQAGYRLSFAGVLGVSYLTPALTAAVRAFWRGLRRIVSVRSEVEEQIRRVDAPQATHSGLVGRTWRPLRLLKRRSLQWLSVSFGAWLMALPVIATWFMRVPLWGAINSALVFPLVVLVMLLGFVKLGAGLVSPTLSVFLAYPLGWADSFLVWVVDLLAQLPGAAVSVPAPPWWVSGLYYALLASFVLLWAPRGWEDVERVEEEPTPSSAPPPRPRVLRHVLCSGALVAWTLSMALWLWPTPPSNRLVVTVLAVGGGTATVLELPDGRTILYDAGSSRPFDVGAGTIVPFLQHRGITSLDRVYVSHPNLDHFSGLPTIVERISTGPIMVNERFEVLSPERSPARRFLELMAARGQEVSVLDPKQTEWTLGGVRFERVWPPSEPDLELDANDSSTVLRVSYAGHSLLLTGDIEEYPQQTLAARGDLHADVLLLPHHGSVRTSSAAFFRAVDPADFVRSSHQRMEDTASALPDLVGDVPIFNTADVGAVEIVLSAEGVQVTGFRPALVP